MRLAQAFRRTIQLFHALYGQEGCDFTRFCGCSGLGDAAAKLSQPALLQLRAEHGDLFLVSPAPHGEKLRRGLTGRESAKVEHIIILSQAAAALQDGGYSIAVGVKIGYFHISPLAFAAASSRSSAFSTYSRGQARFTRWKSS